MDASASAVSGPGRNLRSRRVPASVPNTKRRKLDSLALQRKAGAESPSSGQSQEDLSNAEMTNKEPQETTTSSSQEEQGQSSTGEIVAEQVLFRPPPPSSPLSSSSQKDSNAKYVTIKSPETTDSKSLPESPRKYTKISKTQMKEFREAFGFFDKDGDGSITKDELGIVMRSLGQYANEEELKEMLKEVDIDGDGTFSFDEFVQIVTNYAGPTSSGTDEEQELRDAFRIFDKHNRGYISASDLRAVLTCLGEDLSEDEIEDMIKEVDVDGDGRIDFNEFVRALGEPDTTDDEGD